MKRIKTTLQPSSLLNRQDLSRMKEGRHITTPDFDAYWDHTESSVTYTDAQGELHEIGELYRDHDDALWTFNGKGPGGENLAHGMTPKAGDRSGRPPVGKRPDSFPRNESDPPHADRATTA